MEKLKPRKCYYRKCEQWFTPKVYYQRFHTRECGIKENNAKLGELLKKARKHEGAVA